MIPVAVVTLDSNALVPECWRNLADGGHVYAFNPAVVRVNGFWLLAYRLVLADGLRRIAICRLNDDLQPVRETILALSDLLAGAGAWHADPRFCIIGDRLLLHFNTGGTAPNQIYCVELDRATLQPRGPAKPLRRRGSRRAVEKNWLLFDYGGHLHAIYEIAPHTTLRFLESDGLLLGVPAMPTEWNASTYAKRFGTLRGGTPPVRVGDSYYAFFHSIVRPRPGVVANVMRRLGGVSNESEYVCGFYGFTGTPPFDPVCFTPSPVLRSRAHRRLPPLNPAAVRVVYPSGAVFDAGQWLVSYGLNDEQCCLEIIPHDDLLGQTTAAHIVAPV
jgi:hypothetical protein